MHHNIILRLTDSTYPYVHVTYTDDAVSLDYGYHYTDESIAPAMTETLPFVDYPELRGLHDACGWNLTELFCLFDWEGHYATLKQRKAAARMSSGEKSQQPVRALNDALTQQVFDYIVAYFADFGWAPTVVEIAAGVHIAQGMVHKHLTTLEAWGYIRRDPGKCRALRLL